MTATSHNCHIGNVYPKIARIDPDYKVFFTWNFKTYAQLMVGDFIGFIVMMAGDEVFELHIEGERLDVQIMPSYSGYVACCVGVFDGDSSKYIASGKTKQSALKYLIEQIAEYNLAKQ